MRKLHNQLANHCHLLSFILLKGFCDLFQPYLRDKGVRITENAVDTPIDSEDTTLSMVSHQSAQMFFMKILNVFISVRIGRAFALKIFALFMLFWQKPLCHNQQCDMIVMEYFPYYLYLFSWNSANRPAVQWNSPKKLWKSHRTLVLETMT